MDQAVSWLIGILLVGGALTVILALIRGRRVGRADFEIRHGPGGRVEVRGQVPRSKVAGIRAFFQKDLGAAGPGKVRGSFGPQRLLRLEFRGGLSPPQQQRVRNFLMEHLR
ncbi:hypothetical protein BH23PLA1_BH23PLA1_29060 [soil metagenome]